MCVIVGLYFESDVVFVGVGDVVFIDGVVVVCVGCVEYSSEVF